MVIKLNIKGDRRQVAFYPTIELIERIDKFAESEGGSRAYILESIVRAWLDKHDEEEDDEA